MTLTIAIQAGGQSSRMGRDKGLVEIAGIPMIEHVLNRVQGIGDQVLITTNNPAHYTYLSIPLASDAEPGAGALPGLQTALQATTTDHVLILACDMPFVNRALLEHMVSLKEQADVIVPKWEDYFQPMHAIYARQPVLTALNHALAHGKKRMISFYDDVSVKSIEPATIQQFDPEGYTFFNANTPEELAEAERIWSKIQKHL